MATMPNHPSDVPTDMAADGFVAAEQARETRKYRHGRATSCIGGGSPVESFNSWKTWRFRDAAPKFEELLPLSVLELRGMAAR